MVPLLLLLLLPLLLLLLLTFPLPFGNLDVEADEALPAVTTRLDAATTPD